MQNADAELLTRSKRFARRVIRFHASLPQEATAQLLGAQILNAGTLIGARYREACLALTKAEFVAKLGECLQHADQTLYWLELLLDEKLVPPARLQPLLQEAAWLIQAFTGIFKEFRDDL